MDTTITSSLSEFSIKVMRDSTSDITELCSRLDRKGIPGTAKKKIGVVKCGLHAMLRIALVFETKFASDPGALSRLLVAWEHIWAWMEFFHTTCVIDAVYGEMLRIMSLRVIPITISSLGRDQQLRGTIARTSGVVAILTRHWLQENMYLSQIELAGIGSLFSGALRVLLRPITISPHDCTPVLDLMVAAAGDAQTIARTSVKHARNEKSQSSSNSADYWRDIHTHADLVFLSASVDIPALRRALLSQKDTVDLAVEVLHILSGCPRGTVQAEKCLFPMFSILLELFLSASGFHWIIRAVEAGVLEDILRLGVQLDRGRMSTDMPADLFTRFFTLLSQMLVYRSFLRSLAKATRKVERACIGPDDTAILWTPWIAFKNDAERCLQFKATFEQEIQSGFRVMHIRSCENPKVERVPLFEHYLQRYPLVPEQVCNKGGHVMRRVPGVYIILVLALWHLRGVCLRM
jgi:hypothetical protein